MGGALGCQQDQIDRVHVMGFVHDIGKNTVPAGFPHKPGKLSKYELNIINAHSQMGNDIIKKLIFPWPAADIVLQDHERLGGSGYPQGLSGADIAMEAKMQAVADVTAVMSPHRPYRAGLGLESTMAEITENRRILDDTEAVGACVKLFTEKALRFEA